MEWIEINEERSNLPPICTEVLVTTHTSDGFVTEISLFEGDGIFYDVKGFYDWDHKVIAWMYIPKPFKK